jgi:hypothetical protein
MGLDVSDVTVDCYPEVILQANAGMRKIKLSWNDQDFNPSEVTFNLCRAQEEVPRDGFSRCKDLKEATFETKVTNPLALTELVNDIPLWLQLEANYVSGRQTLSKVVKAIPFGGLNDSGIDWCANEVTNRFSDGTKSEKSSSCEALAADFPGQDAFWGRDALARNRKLSKTGSGAAGFDFTKLCQSGQVAGEGKCSPNPLPGGGLHNWACNRDNVTGLIWEVKSARGLRGKDNTYTWNNTKTTKKDGASGVKNGGKCEGRQSTSSGFVVPTIGDCRPNENCFQLLITAVLSQR